MTDITVSFSVPESRIPNVLLHCPASLCYAHCISCEYTVKYCSKMVPYSILIGLQVLLTGAGGFIVAVLQEAAVRASMEKMDKVSNILMVLNNNTE